MVGIDAVISGSILSEAPHERRLVDTCEQGYCAHSPTQLADPVSRAAWAAQLEGTHDQAVRNVTLIRGIGLARVASLGLVNALGRARTAGGEAPPESAAGGTEALATRAGEVHGAMHPIAQRMRTTAVLETSGGRVVAGGGPDLTPAQRALLGPGEAAARLPGAHAEVTALTQAQQAGVTPQAMAVTRTICPQCAAVIEASGGTVTSPTTAMWPR